MDAHLTEDDLMQLPLRAIVALAIRCARRQLAKSDSSLDDPKMSNALNCIFEIAVSFAKGGEPKVAEAREHAHQIRAFLKPRTKKIAKQTNAESAVRDLANIIEQSMESVSLSRRMPQQTEGDRSGALDKAKDVAIFAADLAAYDAKRARVDFALLLDCKLGRFPDAGKRVDPSDGGPLGPANAE